MLQGFRNIHSIRKVLCHELSHNVHSNHNSEFYALMREVEGEIVALNWQKTSSNSLSTRTSSRADSVLHSHSKMASTLIAASVKCTQRHSNDPQEATALTPSASIEASTSAPFDHLVADSKNAFAARVDYAATTEIGAAGSTAGPSVVSGAAARASEESITVKREVLSRVDDAVANLFMTCDENILERLELMRTALSGPVDSLSPDELGETLLLLKTILHNARTRTEEKYRSFRKTNATFMRYCLISCDHASLSKHFPVGS